MTTFMPKIRPTLPFDPFKHVNFKTGMVLGVDDFSQEFMYLSGRDQWLTREVLGYGTVTGLEVVVEIEDGEPQVIVKPGVAINPRGQLIRVTSTQCARLNAWLTEHRSEVFERIGSPPIGVARLYVVLCYRECEVELRPIPGEPCRSEDDAMEASRLQDDYQLALRWDAPDQRQEDALRDFVAWLRLFTVDDALVDSDVNRDLFEDAIRDAVPQFQSPPASPPMSPPDYMLESPPTSVQIPRDALCDYLRLAYRIWSTELRPLWLGKNQRPDGFPPDEECVLLAQLDVEVTADGQVPDGALPLVDQTYRPFLLPLRMLQEWMLCGITSYLGTSTAETSPPELPQPGVLVGDVTGQPDANTINALQGFPVVASGLNAGDAGSVLTFDGTQWIPQSLTAPTSPPETAPPGDLVGDVTGQPDANSINALQGFPVVASGLNADNAGSVLTFDGTQWIPQSPAASGSVELSGDVSGPSNAAVVGALQGVAVAATRLTRRDDGKVLTFNGQRWQAAVIPAQPIPPQFIVAAGRFTGDGTTMFAYNNLAAFMYVFNGVLLYFLTFDNFDINRSYVVKATMVNRLFGQPRIIEVIDASDEEVLNELREVLANYGNETGNQLEAEQIIALRVSPENREELPRGLMIEISDFSDV